MDVFPLTEGQLTNNTITKRTNDRLTGLEERKRLEVVKIEKVSSDCDSLGGGAWIQNGPPRSGLEKFQRSTRMHQSIPIPWGPVPPPVLPLRPGSQLVLSFARALLSLLMTLR